MSEALKPTDADIDAALAWNRKNRWNNDGRQYDRDTIRQFLDWQRRRTPAAPETEPSEPAGDGVARAELVAETLNVIKGWGGVQCLPWEMVEEAIDRLAATPAARPLADERLSEAEPRTLPDVSELLVWAVEDDESRAGAYPARSGALARRTGVTLQNPRNPHMTQETNPRGLSEAEQRLDAFLAQFSPESQERIIRYALDHVVPRMRSLRAAPPQADPPAARVEASVPANLCTKHHCLWAGDGCPFCKLAAAEPAPLPVLKITGCVCGETTKLGTVHRVDGPCYQDEPAPAPPSPAGRLTDAEIEKHFKAVLKNASGNTKNFYRDFARAIEAACARPAGSIRYDIVQEFAVKNRLSYNETAAMVQDATGRAGSKIKFQFHHGEDGEVLSGPAPVAATREPAAGLTDAQPVAWQIRCRMHPKWRDCPATQVDEYRAGGWEVRALGVIDLATQPATGALQVASETAETFRLSAIKLSEERDALRVELADARIDILSLTGKVTVERAEGDRLRAELAGLRAQEPVAWVRFRSDGGYEGPLMDCAIDDVRKQSGAWTPLVALPAPPGGANNPEPVARVLEVKP